VGQVASELSGHPFGSIGFPGGKSCNWRRVCAGAEGRSMVIRTCSECGEVVSTRRKRCTSKSGSTARQPNTANSSACDEMGVLVWQDFMFGCGLVSCSLLESALCGYLVVWLTLQYPSYDSLNANIKEEAEWVVKQLRNHPSVVIFAGNNEDYQIAESEGRP
jgi:hypothetical protein